MHLASDRALSGLIQAETYQQIRDVVERLTVDLGFRYYGFQFWPGGPEYQDDGFTGTVQCNYPEAWQKRYVDCDYYYDDPTVAYTREKEGVIAWEMIPRWNTRQERVMLEAARYGLEAGVVASSEDASGGRIQITLAGPAGEGDHHLAQQMLQVITPVLAVCYRRAHQLEEKISWMTERQRDVFLLLRQGKRREEVADELSVSLRQVDRHISTIKNKTRQPSIQRAIDLVSAG